MKIYEGTDGLRGLITKRLSGRSWTVSSEKIRLTPA